MNFRVRRSGLVDGWMNEGMIGGIVVVVHGVDMCGWKATGWMRIFRVRRCPS